MKKSASDYLVRELGKLWNKRPLNDGEKTAIRTAFEQQSASVVLSAARQVWKGEDQHWDVPMKAIKKAIAAAVGAPPEFAKRVLELDGAWQRYPYGSPEYCEALQEYTAAIIRVTWAAQNPGMADSYAGMSSGLVLSLHVDAVKRQAKDSTYRYTDTLQKAIVGRSRPLQPASTADLERGSRIVDKLLNRPPRNPHSELARIFDTKEQNDGKDG